ncbi:asialoglycoprotein receptor 1-like [Sceloporus undulatus]|uniref:asialoglycoprotein receptor 1-like n=1 Tax=Sceloporus undulatus TaxID=8520 RepID=UPI001C4B9118|nr:asialoglycoprotein receptor 1-like [Sceloporus undulatus]
MSQDYQDLTSLDVEDMGGKPIQKVPARLPPSPTWSRRLCPSRRLVLLLLGLCAALLLAVIVFAAKGSNHRSQINSLRETLQSLNGTVAEEMASLQSRGKDADAKVTQIEGTVKQLTEEGETARTRLQGQVNELQKNLRNLNCDLENFKRNRSASPEACCPKNWVSFRKSCYWESIAQKSWEDAKADCEARYAHLVIINSYEEQQFVAVRVRPNFMWIGLTDASGAWKWVDGSPYTIKTEEWCPEQPDNWYGHGLGGGEDCAHLTSESCWNDDHCSRLYGFICEMEEAN